MQHHGSPVAAGQRASRRLIDTAGRRAVREAVALRTLAPGMREVSERHLARGTERSLGPSTATLGAPPGPLGPSVLPRTRHDA
ncbi:hypothetical protein ABT404_32135 [Streptomyces hyaluromycini]|uniref:Uncharacterized protein n=1 Tax=Streptomyces hyaluromycini TaxID=1377993 RepID=A0ABV1X529_9ACTN